MELISIAILARSIRLGSEFWRSWINLCVSPSALCSILLITGALETSKNRRKFRSSQDTRKRVSSVTLDLSLLGWIRMAASRCHPGTLKNYWMTERSPPKCQRLWLVLSPADHAVAGLSGTGVSLLVSAIPWSAYVPRIPISLTNS